MSMILINNVNIVYIYIYITNRELENQPRKEIAQQEENLQNHMRKYKEALLLTATAEKPMRISKSRMTSKKYSAASPTLNSLQELIQKTTTQPP